MLYKVAVVVSDIYPDKAPMDLIKRELEGCEVDLYEYSDLEELYNIFEGYDAVVLRTGTLPDGIFEKMPNLKMIGIGSSGYDRIDIDAATENGVLITNNPEAHGPTVSEGVYALIFALVRDLPTQIQLVKDNDWEKSRKEIEYNVPLLEYSTLGIIGLGEIGFSVGQKGTGIFENVLGYDPYLVRYDAETVENEDIELVDDLMDLFERSDVVTIHTPLTNETRGLVGSDELGVLEGYIVNTSRGGIVNESALLEALKNEGIRGAALDVLENEPPSPDDPILDAPNTIITPHRAGIGKRPPEVNTYRLSAKKISTFLQGGEPDNMVNPDALEEQ